MNAEQLQRITEMENILDCSNDAMSALFSALDDFERCLPPLKRLIAYYESDLWRTDYSADCAGQLPTELKRGVLSEDAVYDLLTDYTRLLEQLRALGNRHKV